MPEGVRSKFNSTTSLISSKEIFSDSKVFINIDVGSAIPMAYDACISQ